MAEISPISHVLFWYITNPMIVFFVYWSIQMSRMKVQMGWEFVLPYDLEFIQK